MATPIRHRDKWRIRWIDADGRRQSEVYDDFNDAKRALRAREVEPDEIRAGTRAKRPEDRTFAELCDHWLDTRCAMKRSAKDDQSICKRLREFFGDDQLLGEIGVEDVDAYIDEHDDPLQHVVHVVVDSALPQIERRVLARPSEEGFDLRGIVDRASDTSGASHTRRGCEAVFFELCKAVRRHDRQMRVVCLSCFDESKEKDRSAIEKVKQWIVQRSADDHARHFREIKNSRELLAALSNQTYLKDVDVLILAAHGYSDGNFQMADGAAATASDVADALKKGTLPRGAVLFVFACNGAKSPELHSLFTGNGCGPKMIIGATRLALSNPMKDAIKLVAEDFAAGRLSLNRAKEIAETALACQIDSHQQVVPPETPFLCVLWGPRPNERYAPVD